MEAQLLQHAAQRCLQGLRGLREPGGGYLAAPPDSPYPYVYSRDMAFVCMALDKAGLHREARGGLEFLLEVQAEEGGWHQRYTAQGRPACNRPGQRDCTGLAVTALCVHLRSSWDEAFARRAWPAVRRGVEYITRHTSDQVGLVHTRHSVHEAPTEEGFEVWANAWCWRAMWEATELAFRRGHAGLSREWAQRAEGLLIRVVQGFWDARLGRFHKVLGQDLRPVSQAPDISATAPIWAGMVPPDSGMGESHMDYITRELWHSELGGYMRFHHGGLIQDWHWYDGGNGPWLFYTALMASAYAKARRLDMARRCLRWCVAQALPQGELPEHIATRHEYDRWRENDPEAEDAFGPTMRRAEEAARFLQWQGRVLWVLPWIFPLAWSHAQLLSAILDYARLTRQALRIA